MTIWVWWHETGRCEAEDSVEIGGDKTPEYVPECPGNRDPSRWRKFQEVEEEEKP